MTMKLITTVSIGSSGPSSINFTNIPQGYTDLCLKMSLRDSSNGGIYTYYGMGINDSSSAVYNQRVFYATLTDYSTPVSQNSANQTAIYFGRIPSNYSSYTANAFSNIEAYFPNYSGSGNKLWSLDMVSDNLSTTAWTASLTANAWNSSAPITSISIGNAGGNWAQYTSASLYGITKGSGGATVS